MAKSTLSDNRKKKRIGRPPVGAILIGVRVPPAGVAQLDGWIKKHAPELSRPEAIRRLVELGLTVKTSTKQGSPARAHRAKQLAAQAINKMGDPTAHPEEQAERRRKLTKGPEEFREVRVDRPKAKGK
jgi:hypothetical protein